jgi:hypothetical protein
MTPSSPPPSDPALAALRSRQKSSVYLAMSFLLLSAMALVALPLTKIPFAVRALAAATDVVIAAVLWLVARQKFNGK